ncbi:hypothetical protein ACSBR1_019656 [Camellia fascicularis]
MEAETFHLIANNSAIVLKYWFSPSNINYGYRDFLSLSDLNNTSKGFLVNDAVIVEAEIKL